MLVSIIIPVYNEERAIAPLIEKLIKTESKLSNINFEIIFVDDCSNDKTAINLEKQKGKYPKIDLSVISLVRNYGQTTAITAGINKATGEVLITLDADMQNDPDDIPHLLEKLNQGYDVVSGWRKNRKDKYLTRVLPSKVANWIISRISGVKLHDYGCTIKAYRKKILDDIKLYGEMHRFIPIYVAWQGGNVIEIPVKHHARKFGNSKYGLSKTFAVMADLIFLKFMDKQFSHPIHLFGGFALFNFGLSIISFFVMIYFKYWLNGSFIQTPLPQLIILFIMVGVLSLFMGFIAEILMRTYYESQDKKSYKVKK